MDYSKPTQFLVDEHAVIVRVLDAVEAVALRDDEPMDVDFFEKAIEFFARFADQCHHAKEEDLLFPVLEQRGVPRDGGPIGCMLSEHVEGREHIGAIRTGLVGVANGDPAARENVRRHALAYVSLLRQHIQKENEVLFVIADRQLSAEDKDELWTQFEHAEREVLEPGLRQKYEAVADELYARAGLETAAV